MPKVNPEILIWARKTAGLSEEDAFQKLGLSGVHRLQALESGDIAPSRRQLVNMSEKYRRPLLTFYLDKPPKQSKKDQDFRTLPSQFKSDSEMLLKVLLRDVHVRKDLVRYALEDAEEDEKLDFVGSAKMEDGVEYLAKHIAEKLNFNRSNFLQHKNVKDAFDALRSSVEQLGVFVLLKGNLGNYHTNIEVSVFRGFALADDVAPFIVINENDSRSAWAFSLMHELCHIFLGQSGISNYSLEKKKIEKFCDSVSAKFLMDVSALRQLDLEGDLENIIHEINSFANIHHLSRTMIAYNLLDQNLISNKIYTLLSDRFLEERRTASINNKEKRGKDTGPDYYVVRKHRVGKKLTNFVARMVSNGTLTTTKAGKVLGVKPTGVKKLAFE